jgi:hypothetical protein
MPMRPEQNPLPAFCREFPDTKQQTNKLLDRYCALLVRYDKIASGPSAFHHSSRSNPNHRSTQMVQATKTLPHRQMEALDRASPREVPAMNEDDRAICALVRWLARKAVKAEWKAMGRNPQCADATATNVYLMEHREELLNEARAHPVAIHYRHQERMRLARKAVIAEIRDRGGRVNSIAPEDSCFLQSQQSRRKAHQCSTSPARIMLRLLIDGLRISLIQQRSNHS